MRIYKSLYNSLAFATAASLFVIIAAFTVPRAAAPVTKPAAINKQSLYTQYHYGQYGLSDSVYQLALTGWNKLKDAGEVSKDILCICDFTQSSTTERFFVIDLASGKMLFNTLVAHGKNSGGEYARSFSNTTASNKSSLGFYATGNTYMGQHGLSLKLKGMEKGFNDKAEDRAIVLHGADYVSCNFIEAHGRLGRSFGCPSVPYNLHQPIIQAIKQGSCLFIYYPDKNYLASSELVR